MAASSAPATSMAASSAPASDGVSAAASQKVYLFCLCDCLDNDGLLEDVYVFDIDTNPMLLNLNAPVAPAIRFDCGYPMGICILNSRLYLFDGFDYKCNPNGKSVHFYDFPSSSSSCSGGKPELLVMEKLQQCPSMIGQKLDPVAMPTPDRTKILVFSSRIMVTTRTEGYVDFEIYDYSNGTSEELPLPPLPDHLMSPPQPYFCITAYYFTNDTTFILHTDTSVGLAFDLNQKQWKVIMNDYTCLDGAEVVRVTDGDLGVSRYEVYDMIKGQKCSNIPPNPNVDEHLSRRFYKVMTLVDANLNQSPKICILYTDFDWEHRENPFRPRVYIDVHQIDRAAAISHVHRFTNGGGGRRGGGRGSGGGRHGDKGRRGGGRGSGGGRHGDKGYMESTVNIIKSWSYEFELSIPYKMFEPSALYTDRVILK